MPHKLYFLLWNVRGLIKLAKRETMMDVVKEYNCDVAMLQETKIVFTNIFLHGILSR